MSFTMPESERLARIEQMLTDNNVLVKELREEMPRIARAVERNTQSIEWIVRLGSIGLTISSVVSGWVAFFKDNAPHHR